mmetsp:Transcript_48319/g.113078  ORF Transcript_48319/g.113078 Transcript_48319/m.113078 type:complete len:321 (-) Transcript_48319:190-1152(-)
MIMMACLLLFPAIPLVILFIIPSLVLATPIGLPPLIVLLVLIPLLLWPLVFGLFVPTILLLAFGICPATSAAATASPLILPPCPFILLPTLLASPFILLSTLPLVFLPLLLPIPIIFLPAFPVLVVLSRVPILFVVLARVPILFVLLPRVPILFASTPLIFPGAPLILLCLLPFPLITPIIVLASLLVPSVLLVASPIILLVASPLLLLVPTLFFLPIVLLVVLPSSFLVVSPLLILFPILLVFFPAVILFAPTIILVVFPIVAPAVVILFLFSPLLLRRWLVLFQLLQLHICSFSQFLRRAAHNYPDLVLQPSRARSII